MISSLKQKQASSITETYKKFTTNHETLGFQHLCKENIRQQIDFSKLGKFVFNNIRVIKLNLKLKCFLT